MLFDLRKFFSAGISPSEKRFTADFSDRRFADVRMDAPVDAVFTAIRLEDSIELHLEATATVSGECARCLDSVVRQEIVDTVWTIKKEDLDDPDFELPRAENGFLDVEEWLSQEFSLQIPAVLLCSPDCLGLCPVCGKKRQDCTCPTAAQSAPADARLSILKSLLN